MDRTNILEMFLSNERRIQIYILEQANRKIAPAVNLQFAVPKFHLIKKENGQYRRKNQSNRKNQGVLC